MAAPANSEGLRKRRPSLSDSDEDYGTDDSSDEKEMQNIVKDIESDKLKQETLPDSRWTKMKSTMKQWGETSSCHGIPHMAQAHTIIAVIVWAIILFFCACGFVYLFSDTLLTYLAFGKLVQLNFAMESSNFPSITFCNINPYKLSEIKKIPELAALLTVYESSANGTLTS
ncbi:hypothetical protein WR25_22499 [Diploscapter pachys]|uniref:Uncharacterized protein n=1 Tax=Diploscapter pachys TaxID=2018661 RepID=A0A2A2JXP5_9BILA|nr:hypothetical protein WR25_22499 [Diploscapter pachys]